MGKYDDIINMEHHVSKKHKQMTLHDRSAQFAPFAALEGYGDMVEETARIVDKKIEISEEKQKELDEKLRKLKKDINLGQIATFIYFVPDSKKVRWEICNNY